MRPRSILIADDQKLFAQSLKRVLESDPRATASVFVASSGEEAVELHRTLRPDVVLLDVSMPDLNGVEALRAIRADDPEAVVVMLTAFGYDEYVHAAMAAGAKGYVLKDITPDELQNVIRTVAGGGIVLSPEVTGGAFKGDSSSGTAGATGGREWFYRLTDKERDLLRLIARGFSNGEIGDTLHLGPQTVRNYTSALYAKIGARDRFEAIRLAIETGFDHHVESTNVTDPKVHP